MTKVSAYPLTTLIAANAKADRNNITFDVAKTEVEATEIPDTLLPLFVSAERFFEAKTDAFTWQKYYDKLRAEAVALDNSTDSAVAFAAGFSNYPESRRDDETFPRARASS